MHDTGPFYYVATVVGWTAALTVGALFLTFALPFIGSYSAILVAESLGCEIGTPDRAPCVLLGLDVGTRLNWMVSFGALLATPIYFIIAFGKDVIILSAISAVSFVLARNQRDRV